MNPLGAGHKQTSLNDATQPLQSTQKGDFTNKDSTAGRVSFKELVGKLDLLGKVTYVKEKFSNCSNYMTARVSSLNLFGDKSNGNNRNLKLIVGGVAGAITALGATYLLYNSFSVQSPLPSQTPEGVPTPTISNRDLTPQQNTSNKPDFNAKWIKTEELPTTEPTVVELPKEPIIPNNNVNPNENKEEINSNPESTPQQQAETETENKEPNQQPIESQNNSHTENQNLTNTSNANKSNNPNTPADENPQDPTADFNTKGMIGVGSVLALGVVLFVVKSAMKCCCCTN